ncbi:MAG: Eco57I restriction-modification methylase domain-containing protein [Thermoplasmata archaeon]
MADKDSFRSDLESLVQVYASHEREYRDNREYNEFSLRREFLDEFFRALDWDMRNASHQPPHRREVRFERPNELRRRPDYTFLVDQRARFIVEAKAPSESLDNALTISQAKSYAWNSRDVSIAILTNFSELKVYDGSLRPDRNHPERGLLKHISFRDYAQNIDYLWNFAKPSVAAGSLEALLPEGPRERQYRVPVDEAFLAQITDWRAALAKDLYKRSPTIASNLLNEVVQRTLDRLVFIRMAEDRGIVPDHSLWDIIQTWKQQSPNKPIQGLVNGLYRKIHEDLDGEIFEPHACEFPEYWFSPALVADLVENLYFPRSPFMFDVIGVELLGRIYERYLGKTLRLTEKRVHLEEKPEVRKAGGVYYTPGPIVEYIVETAVGRRIAGKPPQELSKFRVLDPACGSGSFLVAAYSRLIDEHVRFYETHPGTARRGTLFPDLIVDGDTSRLSIEKKSQILRDSIFGVDIDPQAVEITMMSLYLKALEGEQTLPSNKALLPRLKENVRCGNSLVEPQPFKQLSLTGESPDTRLNPFDWNSPSDGFGGVMAEGKFDAVIGNPPYIRIQQLREWSPAEAEFVQKNYPVAAKGNVDIYIPFVAKGLDLLSEHGLLGFILPHKFFQANYGARIRELIADGGMLQHLVSFGHQQVFDGATTYTCLMFLGKDRATGFRYVDFSSITDLGVQLHQIETSTSEFGSGWTAAELPQVPPGDQTWHLTAGASTSALFERLRANWPALEDDDVADIFRGGQTSADNVFILELVSPPRVRSLSGASVKVKVEGRSEKPFLLETRFLKPLFKSGEFHRNFLDDARRVLIFPYAISNGKASLIDIEIIEEQAPRTWKYLLSRKGELQGRKGAKKWWAFGYPKNLADFEGPKLITRDLAPKAWYCPDLQGGVYFPGGAAGGYGIRPVPGLDLRYLLGLLNSRLLDKLLQDRSTPFRNGWFSYEYRFIKDLPIRTIQADDKAARKMHDEIVFAIDRLLVLYPRVHNMPTSNARELLEREIRTLEEGIESHVGALYGLSQEDLALIST